MTSSPPITYPSSIECIHHQPLKETSYTIKENPDRLRYLSASSVQKNFWLRVSFFSMSLSWWESVNRMPRMNILQNERHVGLVNQCRSCYEVWTKIWQTAWWIDFWMLPWPLFRRIFRLRCGSLWIFKSPWILLRRCCR